MSCPALFSLYLLSLGPSLFLPLAVCAAPGVHPCGDLPFLIVLVNRCDLHDHITKRRQTACLTQQRSISLVLGALSLASMRRQAGAQSIDQIHLCLS